MAICSSLFDLPLNLHASFAKVEKPIMRFERLMLEYPTKAAQSLMNSYLLIQYHSVEIARSPHC